MHLFFNFYSWQIQIVPIWFGAHDPVGQVPGFLQTFFPPFNRRSGRLVASGYSFGQLCGDRDWLHNFSVRSLMRCLRRKAFIRPKNVHRPKGGPRLLLSGPLIFIVSSYERDGEKHLLNGAIPTIERRKVLMRPTKLHGLRETKTPFVQIPFVLDHRHKTIGYCRMEVEGTTICFIDTILHPVNTETTDHSRSPINHREIPSFAVRTTRCFEGAGYTRRQIQTRIRDVLLRRNIVLIGSAGRRGIYRDRAAWIVLRQVLRANLINVGHTDNTTVNNSRYRAIDHIADVAALPIRKLKRCAEGIFALLE